MVPNAIAKGDLDKEDKDLRLDLLTSVTQLLHLLSKRTRRMPARDRYFLS